MGRVKAVEGIAGKTARSVSRGASSGWKSGKPGTKVKVNSTFSRSKAAGASAKKGVGAISKNRKVAGGAAGVGFVAGRGSKRKRNV